MEVVHPRPQLTRPDWIDLSGPWGFAYDDADVGLVESWQARTEVFARTIEVPFPPESTRSGIADTGFHPVVWYRRTFARPERSDTDRLLLHFGAVDYRAHVWVDGQLVATHEGGHTPFSADITDQLSAGGDGDHILVVRAEDRPEDMRQPRGKQDWELAPHVIWYARTTGIWQPVWLEPVPATRVESVRWTPDADSASLRVAVRLTPAGGEPLRIRVRLTMDGRTLVDDTYAVLGPEVERDIVLSPALVSLDREQSLWSPEHPHLIDATITLLDDNGVVDEVRSYTAMRSVRAEAGRFLLNGHPYFLRMVLAQNFWPESHLAAPDPDALRREVELARRLGFNGLRLHQKIEDPRFLYWCDRLGMLVWEEMPSAYEFSTTTVDRLTQEWSEVLARDHNHPCVVAWVPFNESWGVPAVAQSPQQQAAVRALYHLTKAVDGSRPVIGNDGWEHVVTDVMTVHDYTGDAETLRARYGDRQAVEETVRHVRPGYRAVIVDGAEYAGEPVILSECGGFTLETGDGEVWPGYGKVDDPQALLEAYRSLVEAITDSTALAGFCYTQLTDTLQEKNGLLTEDRKPKVAFEDIAAITRRTSSAT
jgi:beta-galactosidase/beta-glucuronidase